MPKTLRTPRHQKLQEVLLSRRKELGWTQAILGAKLKRPQSFVAKYEGGERRLDVIEFMDVAETLGMNPVEVMRNLLKVRQ